MGLLGTGLSYVYNPPPVNTLEIYTTRENSMRNDWIDVIIINLCLLAYAHWLSDIGKDHTKFWTLVPELVGTAAALVSLRFLQRATRRPSTVLTTTLQTDRSLLPAQPQRSVLQVCVL